MNTDDTAQTDETVDTEAFEEALSEIAGDETAMSWQEAGPRRDIGPRS